MCGNSFCKANVRLTNNLKDERTLRLPLHEKTQVDLSFRSVSNLAMSFDLPPRHMNIFRQV